MKREVNKLLSGLNYNQLCISCENWTQEDCWECGEPICDDCSEEHESDHQEDDED